MKDYGLTVVPLYVKFGDEQYRDGVDIDSARFFEMLVTRDEFPRTSQPTVGDFETVYKKLAKTHDAIVSLHISAKLSGTYASAISAKHNLTQAGEKVRLEVLDTGSVSATLGLVVMEVAERVKAGGSVEEALDCAKAAMARMEFFGMGDTTEYLVKGGRVGKAAGLLGSLLHIKPMIKLEDGAAGPLARARSRTRAIAILKEKIDECKPLARMFVIYTTEISDAEELADYLKATYPELDEVRITHIGPVTGAHMGPRVLGAAFLRAEG